MDSTNPCSQDTSFINLLNSQDTSFMNPFNLETSSPIIQLGSSEQLVFSIDDPSVPVEERKERRKWTPKEDVVLISAWLNTSKDPVVGNEQKAGAFWKRIQAYYNSSPQLLGLLPREASHCKQRWGRLNDQVCKFVGCYEAALKEQSSGQNENDVMKAANDIFFNDHKTRFSLEHAWRELRHDQKWCATSSAKDVAGKSKRRKLAEVSAQSSSSHPLSHGEDEAMGRPPGVKAAKGKPKRNESKSTSAEEEGKELADFQSIWEIKKQDLAMRQTLSKHKLLDSLLAKSEPLSEMENALKNKLISDMLS
ncbi:Glutathione S-transferase T3 [Cardamine amara subsp. amara]|uniref:Glutathione S-transferase T3 n=1 Tax=Cardamine amara subsp. amara TaxID=228776 RepID=A0ABD1ARG4_CARAN